MELDLAADHVVRGLLEQLRSFKSVSRGARIAFPQHNMGKWVNLYDLDICIPPRHVCASVPRCKGAVISCVCLLQVTGLVCVDQSVLVTCRLIFEPRAPLLSSETSEGGQREPRKDSGGGTV